MSGRHTKLGKCIGCMVLAGGLLLQAQSEARYRFDEIGIAEGLSQSSVIALMEDSTGYMWMGTEAGLNIYDGYSIEPFKTSQADADHLTLGRIEGLFGQREDEMWVATPLGVSVIDTRTKAFVRLQHQQEDPAPLRPEGYQRAEFIEDCHDRVWVLRTRAAFSFEHIDGGWQQAHQAYSHGLGFSAIRDAQNTLWLSDYTRLWRVTCQNPAMELVYERPARDGNNALAMGTALAIFKERQLLWARKNGLDVINLETGRKEAEYSVQMLFDQPESILGIRSDEESRLWLVSSAGIGQLDVDGGLGDGAPTLAPFFSAKGDHESLSARVNESEFTLEISSDGLVWTRSEHGTVVLYPNAGHAERMEHDPAKPEGFPAINPEVWQRLYRDRFGVIWLFGGLSGIVQYSAQTNRFERLRNTDWLRPSTRSMQVAEVDGERYLWLSWDGRQVDLWRQLGDGRYEKAANFGPQYGPIADEDWQMMRAMAASDNGIVWLATSHSIWRGDARTKTLEEIHVFDDYATEDGWSRHPNIGLIYDAGHNRLIYSHAFDVWVIELNDANQASKVERLDWLQDPSGIRSQLSLAQLRDGRLVLGSFSTIKVVDLEQKQFVVFDRGFEDQREPEQVVLSISEDADGYLWLGTRNGLGRFVLSTDSQTLEQVGWVDDSVGLADNTIYAQAHDAEGTLWVSTNWGISRVGITENEETPFSVRNYSVVDGLASYEFNRQAVTTDSSGTLYFGGINGLSYFKPSELSDHPHPPDVLLRSVTVNDEHREPIWPETDLSLRFTENNLTIGYTGVHFSAPMRNQYAYQLVGHETQWVNADQERMARYANLPPGTYEFWVRAANLDGLWSEPRRLLGFTIEPPPWATPLAYASYIALLLAMLLMLVRSALKRQQRLEQLVADRTAELGQKNTLIEAQAGELQEALAARTVFFANISHEFRTPLTLIQTAIEQLDIGNHRPEAKQLAMRYLQRLTRLVDQLLDLSRLRLSGVERATAPWSVNQIVAITVDGFTYLAKEREIDFQFQAAGEYRTQVDQASVEKILLNLLSNAFKYTPRGGRIQISLETTGPQLLITIKDDGPGIKVDQQEWIFERFQRIPSEETVLNEGAGIGLALVKEAALAIGGSVTLESAPGQGSAFLVYFPGWTVSELGTEEEEEESQARYLSGSRLQLDRTLLADDGQVSRMEHHGASASEDGAKHSILLVEDNADLRHYLCDLLADQWCVYQAANGIEALEVLEEAEIDVILADIMMPHMDGLTLLKAVRDNLETSHIPFLLLSARHDTESRLMGLTLAADDFLTKPFSSEEIRLKLRNVVLSRMLLRAAILRGFDGGEESKADQETELATQKHLSPRDYKFLERLNQWLAVHHAEHDLTVVEMAAALSVNERTLQRKIRALMGLTPINLLRQYRLEKSKEMLRDFSMSIQEVAFDLGFNSQQAFSRAFKEHFSQTPSQWRATQKNS